MRLPSEGWTVGFQPQEHSPGGLPAAVLHLHVLFGSVNVAPAAFERRGLKDGRRPG